MQKRRLGNTLEVSALGLGFVASYFLETDGGDATNTITEDESGTTESMGLAAGWVQQNPRRRESRGAPEVTLEQALVSATR